MVVSRSLPGMMWRTASTTALSLASGMMSARTTWEMVLLGSGRLEILTGLSQQKIRIHPVQVTAEAFGIAAFSGIELAEIPFHGEDEAAAGLVMHRIFHVVGRHVVKRRARLIEDIVDAEAESPGFDVLGQAEIPANVRLVVALREAGEEVIAGTVFNSKPCFVVQSKEPLTVLVHVRVSASLSSE